MTSAYGTLPAANQLDALDPRRSTTFTAVGHGLQKSFPDAASWKTVANRARMVSEPHLIQISTGFAGPQSLLLSNNANSGGTCFGDSGGPNFLGGSNVVAGVTSFGLNSTCAGTGGVFRVDRPDVLDFVNTYLSASSRRGVGGRPAAPHTSAAQYATAPRPVSAAWRCSSAR